MEGSVGLGRGKGWQSEGSGGGQDVTARRRTRPGRTQTTAAGGRPVSPRYYCGAVTAAPPPAAAAPPPPWWWRCCCRRHFQPTPLFPASRPALTQERGRCRVTSRGYWAGECRVAVGAGRAGPRGLRRPGVATLGGAPASEGGPYAQLEALLAPTPTAITRVYLSK